MRLALAFLSMLLISMAVRAAEPDIIVTQNGEPLKVYNLDITSSDNVYYTLAEDPSAPLQKISKTSILIIKKADGTKIDPSISDHSSSFENTDLVKRTYNPAMFHAIEDDFVDLNFNPTQGMSGYVGKLRGMRNRYLHCHPNLQDGEQLAKFILASDGNGSILNFRLISNEKKTLAVARPRTKKQIKELNIDGLLEMDYDNAEYLIPDYVMINNLVYSVVEIDPRAFAGKKKVKNVIFPETLRIIGPLAFEKCRLNKIILPESLEIVGDMAFYWNVTEDFKEIYIPKRIKQIGPDCFLGVGLQRSPRDYTEAYLSSIPDFITTENCTDFGIDDNAIESYERRKR